MVRGRKLIANPNFTEYDVQALIFLAQGKFTDLALAKRNAWNAFLSIFPGYEAIAMKEGWVNERGEITLRAVELAPIAAELEYAYLQDPNVRNAAILSKLDLDAIAGELNQHDHSDQNTNALGEKLAEQAVEMCGLTSPQQKEPDPDREAQIQALEMQLAELRR